MARAIKFNAVGNEANSIIRGTLALNAKEYGEGPTSTTGFWAGIDPPVGGYTIYGPGNNIRVAADNAELLFIIGKLGGDNGSLQEALDWSKAQSDVVIMDSRIGAIATTGLQIHTDVASVLSYPKQGSELWDMIGDIQFEVDNNPPTYVASPVPHFNFDEGANPGQNLKSLVDPAGISQQTQYSRSAWFRATTVDGAFRNIFCNKIGNNADMSICIEGGKLSFHQYTSTSDYTRRGSTDLVPGEWYYGGFSLNRDTNQLEIYLNGQLDATYTTMPITGSASNEIMIGGPDNDSYAGDRMFNGDIAMFSHWNRILTQAEWEQNFEAHRTRFGI